MGSLDAIEIESTVVAVECIRRRGASSSLAQETLVKHASNVTEIASLAERWCVDETQDSSNDVWDTYGTLKTLFSSRYILRLPYTSTSTGTAVAVVIPKVL